MDEIYFATSIRGGRDDVELYLDLINHLGKYGKVLTEHIGNKALALMGEDGLTDPEIHTRDMVWVRRAGVMVAEVTTASLGVGYELGRVVERNLWVPESEKKPILCLYRPQTGRRLSAMIKGSDGIENREHESLGKAIAEIDSFFSSIKKK